MLKKLLLVFAGILTTTGVTFAQSGTLKGVVTDKATGETLPVVNVFITELTKGDVTNIDGEYTITDVPYGTYTVSVRFVGYKTLEMEVRIASSETVVDFELEEDLLLLDDVVVTAYGVPREEKSLGYAVQSVAGDDLTMVEDNNIVGALSGKVSGVQVVGAAGGNLGGSEKIRIRGTNGLSDGQPLFVVDGTPIDNTSFSNAGAGRDYGNLAQDLNLQDVEDITVLKGAAAAVLFGNRAKDGVILITTKKGNMAEGQSIRVDYSNSTSIENVFILPEYQNEYAGGYNQSYIPIVDPEDQQTYNTLNYAADESWGPKIDGTMYRPWWSWYHHDFTGDGVDDYGTTIPMTAQPDNVRDFYETGVSSRNTLSISGGNKNNAFRASISNLNAKGIVPNQTLDKTYLNFNGSLNHNNKLNSQVSFNYINTKGHGRPAQGYSPSEGSVAQSFNQWFQRQVNMDYLKNYQTANGNASWNIRSATDLRPLYWDSPYFTVYENYGNDQRDRVYGNYALTYNINSNVSVTGKIHLDTYSFVTESRIATGGLELDDYSIQERTSREVNYEAGVNYAEDFGQISVVGFLGGNIRQNRYYSLFNSTEGGLSSPNFFNIAGSVDRPATTSFKRQLDVRSLFGTVALGYNDIVYLEATARNDWSSTLPSNDNSYLYYGLSTSLVFSELSFFSTQDVLSFGKIRASIAQVGNTIDPYSIASTYVSGTAYGSFPTQSVPNTLNNPTITAAISTDYEAGIDMRFLDGRIRTDVAYYISQAENEILDLQVSGASGYSQATINAGEFLTRGLETQLGVTAVQSRDVNVDFTLNLATSYSEVVKLADELKNREIEDAYFGVSLYAREGQEWGLLQGEGGYGFVYHENGERIVGANGFWARELDAEFGHILPDWTGGFRTDVSYKNFNFGAFLDFQKGGQFYSISKMFNAYSGLGAETVGNNSLGNPLRDPLVDANGSTTDADGDDYVSLPVSGAGSNSGGVLVSGVDENGNPVEYLYDAVSYYANMFSLKENWIYDASYIKLREVSVTYNFPKTMLSDLPIQRASLSFNVKNALLLYSSVDGIDPTTVQNGATGFSFWEGGGLPATRSFGFNVNIGF